MTSKRLSRTAGSGGSAFAPNSILTTLHRVKAYRRLLVSEAVLSHSTPVSPNSSGRSSNSPLKSAVLNNSMNSSGAQPGSWRARLLAAPPRGTYPSSRTVARSGTPVFESAAGSTDSDSNKSRTANSWQGRTRREKKLLSAWSDLDCQRVITKVVAGARNQLNLQLKDLLSAVLS